MHELYDRASLFVLPTRYEIFGMVLLEAMYFGLPVLTSLNGGSDLLVQDGVNGFVQRGFDAKAYARVIAELAADPQRQEIVGKAAHETVERDFLWDRIAARMLAEYRKAL